MKKELVFLLLAQFSSLIFANAKELYPNNLKNREFDKNFEGKPTPAKPDSPGCLGINKTELSYLESNTQKSLRTFLSCAMKGDYIVAESGKMFTLIHIRAIHPGTVVLEEISAPMKKKPEKISWPEWVKNKAPGHSSWSILEMDLNNGNILECYSLSKNAYIQISPKESLFATLLRLPLQAVAPQDRRRIGPAPQPGESDIRKLWQPPLVFEGKTIKNPQFNVFKATWPNDESELEGRQVVLYFDQEMRIPLPLWIDVETSHMTFRFHVIDSGKNLIPSIKKQPIPQ